MEFLLPHMHTLCNVHHFQPLVNSYHHFQNILNGKQFEDIIF
jgi:hypothetical protein